MKWRKSAVRELRHDCSCGILRLSNTWADYADERSVGLLCYLVSGLCYHSALGEFFMSWLFALGRARGREWVRSLEGHLSSVID
jgi:hypothetical protein